GMAPLVGQISVALLLTNAVARPTSEAAGGGDDERGRPAPVKLADGLTDVQPGHFRHGPICSQHWKNKPLMNLLSFSAVRADDDVMPEPA
ncbi:MAG TPA: hypothetical protein VI756_11170, partial [Blastocatellia bacterium]